MVANVNFKTVVEADRRALKEIVTRDFDTHNTNLGHIALRAEKDGLIKGIDDAPRESS
ncbi:hypothetical protein [Rickettsia australis]|uniref:Cell surface antigen-like protein Sca8 n=1 Tax=Rickettsia australis (strain Cutlack) TaxID=1105110 RepID=H8K8J2_RICAC|nr:hypothetical protein [Rickettsia australis]AFC71585.1 cell surface antigen-like protein Sca8 [Rickettsia australis str. Cutlack]